MNRVFVTGDVHQYIDLEKLNPDQFLIQSELDKSDTLIICGDAGFVFDSFDGDKVEQYCRNWMAKRSFTTLCCLGNHENYPAIYEFPIVEKFCGKVREIAPSLYYAIGGEVYTLNGKTFCFINGADSQDRFLRTAEVDWWQEERISFEQIDKALSNIASHNQIDYLISHTGGTEVNRFLGFEPTVSDYQLDRILKELPNTQHYCGHYHKDLRVNSQTKILYNDIIELCW